MTLPAGFQFSQSSLQEFEICPRRFKLHYLDRLRWPAVASEPLETVERLARLGTEFHHLVHRRLVGRQAGLDVEALMANLAIVEPELQTWWRNYLNHYPPLLDQARLYPELTLSTMLRGCRLLARFDLVAVETDGAFLIIDWKTTQSQPAREYLARRLQTRIYLYVLAAAGAALNGGQPIAPDAIKLIYWYPHFPDQPEQFDYDLDQFRRDEQFLLALIERVEQAAAEQNFPRAGDVQPCHYCVYRSLCKRGVKAGAFVPLPEEARLEEDSWPLAWDERVDFRF
jgi:RecB family exonuclease